MGGKAKNHIRRFLKAFGAVRTWQMLVVLLPLIFFTATLFRFDHLRMVELRSAVFAADEAGDNDATEQALRELHEFVVTHTVINISESNGVQSIIFGTGPFYLEQSYLRAADAAIEAARATLADDANPNGNIYAAVSAICQPLAIANGWSWYSQGHIDCWTTELAKYPASDELSVALTADVPSTELYRRSYLSPIWTPTPSGFAALACIVLAVAILIRIIIWCCLRLSLLFLKHS